MFLNNRYHDPTTGIFLTVDPLVGKTGDPYLYAAGNPTTLSDPTGLCATDTARAGQCYADYYSRQSSVVGHDRFVATLWTSWYRSLENVRRATKAHFESRGVAFDEGVGWQAEVVEYQADQRFATDIGRVIAGITETGNGVFLRSEEAAGWEGPPDRQGARTAMGPIGWREDLADDNSPEGHAAGYILLAYVYGRAQTTAGLRNVEWDPNDRAHSQQDYDLGVIGINAGANLATSGYSGAQMIRDLDAATRGSWASEASPARIALPDTGQPTLLGSLPCYFGLTC